MQERTYEALPSDVRDGLPREAVQTAAWSAWQAAVHALRKHERTCLECVVDRYCAKGRDLNIAEVTAHRAVTHPGES